MGRRMGQSGYRAVERQGVRKFQGCRGLRASLGAVGHCRMLGLFRGVVLLGVFQRCWTVEVYGWFSVQRWEGYREETRIQLADPFFPGC